MRRATSLILPSVVASVVFALPAAALPPQDLLDDAPHVADALGTAAGIDLQDAALPQAPSAPTTVATPPDLPLPGAPATASSSDAVPAPTATPVPVPGDPSVTVPRPPVVRDPGDYEFFPIHVCLRSTITDPVYRPPCVRVTGPTAYYAI